MHVGHLVRVEKPRRCAIPFAEFPNVIGSCLRGRQVQCVGNACRNNGGASRDAQFLFVKRHRISAGDHRGRGIAAVRRDRPILRVRVREADHRLKSSRNSSDGAFDYATPARRHPARQIQSSGFHPRIIERRGGRLAVVENQSVGAVQYAGAKRFRLCFAIIDDVGDLLIAAPLVDQRAIERSARAAFLGIPHHEHADTAAGRASVEPVNQSVIGIMFRARLAIGEAENIAGFDSGCRAAQVGWRRAIGKRRVGNTHDVTTQPATGDRLDVEISGHVDVRITIPRNVIMSQVRGGDGDFDVIHVHHFGGDIHDRIAVAKEVEPGINLTPPGRILIFNAVVNQAPDISNRDRIGVRAGFFDPAHFEHQPGSSIHRVIVSVGGHPERRPAAVRRCQKNREQKRGSDPDQFVTHLHA